MDLEKFFDRVNHDVLMARVARRMKDKRVCVLIRRYLQAGMMEGGLVSPRTEGTPQGGPLSPLFPTSCSTSWTRNWSGGGTASSAMPTTATSMCGPKAAGERVMASLERFLTKRLRLKVNRDKSAVDRPWNRKFLGYSVTCTAQRELQVAPGSSND